MVVGVGVVLAIMVVAKGIIVEGGVITGNKTRTNTLPNAPPMLVNNSINGVDQLAVGVEAIDVGVSMAPMMMIIVNGSTWLGGNINIKMLGLFPMLRQWQ
jgi:hypothetical protein